MCNSWFSENRFLHDVEFFLAVDVVQGRFYTVCTIASLGHAYADVVDFDLSIARADVWIPEIY